MRRSCSATSIIGTRIATARLFRELADGYEKKGGHRVTSLTYYGERHVTSNKEINKPEDMKGLKIRVPDAPLYTMFPRAVGANPTPIAFAEVYLALQQGTSMRRRTRCRRSRPRSSTRCRSTSSSPATSPTRC